MTDFNKTAWAYWEHAQTNFDTFTFHSGWHSSRVTPVHPAISAIGICARVGSLVVLFRSGDYEEDVLWNVCFGGLLVITEGVTYQCFARGHPESRLSDWALVRIEWLDNRVALSLSLWYSSKCVSLLTAWNSTLADTGGPRVPCLALRHPDHLGNMPPTTELDGGVPRLLVQQRKTAARHNVI
jgi:hypothetical protein